MLPVLQEATCAVMVRGTHYGLAYSDAKLLLGECTITIPHA
jgi:hypothetical protein